MENVGLSDEEARKDAEAMVMGKRVVEDYIRYFDLL